MDQNTYLKTVYDKLRRDGFELSNDKIHEFDVVVAKKFKFTKQMNIFAIMGDANNISKDVIENFSKISLDYTLKVLDYLEVKLFVPLVGETRTRIMEAAVGSFALLVSSNIDEDAKQWVQQRPKKHFAAFEIPVIFDLKKNEIYHYKKTPIWGAIHYRFFRNFIKKYFK